jgi:hypothetical protein
MGATPHHLSNEPAARTNVAHYSDALFASPAKVVTSSAAALAGCVHGMMPMIHRAMKAMYDRQEAREMELLYDEVAAWGWGVGCRV